MVGSRGYTRTLTVTAYGPIVLRLVPPNIDIPVSSYAGGYAREHNGGTAKLYDFEVDSKRPI